MNHEIFHTPPEATTSTLESFLRNIIDLTPEQIAIIELNLYLYIVDLPAALTEERLNQQKNRLTSLSIHLKCNETQTYYLIHHSLEYDQNRVPLHLFLHETLQNPLFKSNNTDEDLRMLWLSLASISVIQSP